MTLRTEQLGAVVDIATRCRLFERGKRKLLLYGIPESLQAQLDTLDSPKEQLLSDIRSLNSMTYRTTQGTLKTAIWVWITNAVQLLHPRKEAEELIEALGDQGQSEESTGPVYCLRIAKSDVEAALESSAAFVARLPELSDDIEDTLTEVVHLYHRWLRGHSRNFAALYHVVATNQAVRARLEASQAKFIEYLDGMYSFYQDELIEVESSDRESQFTRHLLGPILAMIVWDSSDLDDLVDISIRHHVQRFLRGCGRKHIAS